MIDTSYCRLKLITYILRKKGHYIGLAFVPGRPCQLLCLLSLLTLWVQTVLPGERRQQTSPRNLPVVQGQGQRSSTMQSYGPVIQFLPQEENNNIMLLIIVLDNSSSSEHNCWEYVSLSILYNIYYIQYTVYSIRSSYQRFSVASWTMILWSQPPGLL